MAVPASLKSADIGRFALRAQQLQQAKPVVAYWCNYWIVQVIITKGLHNADDEAMAYTTSVMDNLEQFKNEHSTDDTVTDDVAGKAYVEQFALETFARADNAVRANKASKQTAETFQAAAVFLELLGIWGGIEPDIQQKIKYAKFHALRIVKALKAGEDPNLSNPQQPEPDQAAPELDPHDPDGQALNEAPGRHRQPSVTDAYDETDAMQASLAKQSSLDESIHPSRAPSVPPPNEGKTPQAASARVSPLPQDAADFYHGNQTELSPVSPDRKSSIGGNYFPRMPSPTSAAGSQPSMPPTLPSAPDSLDHGLSLPSAPSIAAVESAQPQLPTAPSEPSLPPAPATFRHAQPLAPKTPLDSFQAPSIPGPPPATSAPTHLSPAPPQQATTAVSQQPLPASYRHSPHNSHATPVRGEPTATNPQVEVDEEAMMTAQKHARWAISALNFEDVPTAIKEFELALRTLGAR